MSNARTQSSHNGRPGDHNTHHKQHKHHNMTWYVGWALTGAAAVGLGFILKGEYEASKDTKAAWLGQYAGHLGCLQRTKFNPSHDGRVGTMHQEEIHGQEREVMDVNSLRLSDDPHVLKFVVNEHTLDIDIQGNGHFWDAPTFGSANRATHDYLEHMDNPQRPCPDDNR